MSGRDSIKRHVRLLPGRNYSVSPHARNVSHFRQASSKCQEKKIQQYFFDGEGDCGRALPSASLPPNPKKSSTPPKTLRYASYYLDRPNFFMDDTLCCSMKCVIARPDPRVRNQTHDCRMHHHILKMRCAPFSITYS